MPGGIRPKSPPACAAIVAAGIGVFSVSVAGPARADMPAQLMGYVQVAPFEATVGGILTRRDAEALMSALRPSLDLWRDRGVPIPFGKALPPFAPTGDLGVLVGRLVEAAAPHLKGGDAPRVERLLNGLNRSRCLRAWSIARDYSGPLDVSLSLRERDDREWEIQASLRPPADPRGQADRSPFKGLSLSFPTGVKAPEAGRTQR